MKGPDKGKGSGIELASQFPEIERLLETEDFEPVNKGFRAAYEQLEKLGTGRGGVGKASKSEGARKAMKAIERVMDLLRYLLKMKYEMGSGDSAPHGKK